MAALWKNNLVNGRTRNGESGQALMEFALIGSVMIILLLDSSILAAPSLTRK